MVFNRILGYLGYENGFLILEKRQLQHNCKQVGH